MVKKVKTEESVFDKDQISDEVKENKPPYGEASEERHEIKTTSSKKNKREDIEQKEEIVSKEDELSKKLHESEEKNKELQDKYLRLSAEFDNYRKRTLKEKMELAKTAGESIMLNIIGVIDDFERGIKTISDAKEIDPVKEGIYLIYNKFNEFLTQNGVKEIEAVNKDFNIDFHEAITNIPAPSEELKGKVVDVIEKGYTLNDKVIRYSKVVVGE